MSDHLEQSYPLAKKFYFRLFPALLFFFALTIALVGFVIQKSSEKIYLERAIKVTDNIANDISSQWPLIWQQTLKGQPISNADLAKLSEAFSKEQFEYKLIGLKVYALSKKILYSHRVQEIGSLENNQALRAVIEQGTSSIVTKQEKDGSTVLELYIPYYQQGKIAAVFELYESVHGEYTFMLKGLFFPIILSLFGTLGVLTLLFFPIVRSAQREIEKRTSVIISMRKRLEKLVSRRAVSAMQENQSSHGKSEMEIDITVFYSDIRGFTAFSENQSPEKVFRTLNNIIDIQVQEIESEGGDIDKFVGDAVFAYFEGEDRWERATRAAISIQKKLSHSEHSLTVGIGLYSGPAVAGLLGSGDRIDFTIIGDTVNVAARLCSNASGGEIIADKKTIGLAKRNDFNDENTIVVKGRQAEIAILKWQVSD